MATIQEQIKQQRTAIESATQQLQERRARQPTQQELRGIDRISRQQVSPLTARAKRKAEKELAEKSLREVSQFETKFEKEVAEKAPQYGKEKYVEVEYQKAKGQIQDKISKVQEQIKEKKARQEYYQDVGKDVKADEFRDEVFRLEAKISGYQQAMKGSKVQVIQNVTSGYADRLAEYEKDVEKASQQRSEQIKSFGFKSFEEYRKALPTLTKLSKKIATTEAEISKLPSKIQEQIVYKEVPATDLAPITDYKAPTPKPTEFRNIFTGERISAREAPSDIWIPTTTIFGTITEGFTRIPEKKGVIARVEEFVSGFVTPSKLIKKFDWLGEKTIGAGEFISTKMEKRFIARGGDVERGVGKVIFKTPSPISRETAKQIIGNLYLFSSFAPLMKTGVEAQLESEFVYDVKSKRFVKKSELERYLKLKQEGKLLRDKTFSEKLDDVTKLMNKLEIAPKDLKSSLARELKTLLKKTYGKTEFERLIKEYSAQRFGVTTYPQPETSAIDLFGKTIERVAVPEMKGVGFVGAGVSAFAGKGQYERTDEAVGRLQPTKQLGFFADVDKEIQRDLEKQKTKQLQLLAQPQPQLQRQIELLKQPQLIRQKEIQKQKQPQLQRTALLSLLSLRVGQAQVQKLTMRQPPRQTQRLRQPEPKPPTPIIPIPLGIGKALKKVKKILVEEDGFEIFVTKGGKDILVGKEKTQAEAESLLRGTLRKTLRAGGFLTKKGKKLKARELKTFGGGEFRLSKVSPYKIIEKKAKRLRKGTTGFGIQAFRPKKGKKKSGLIL